MTIDASYTSWGCGRPMNHPSWCLPISFTHDTKRAGDLLRRMARAAERLDPELPSSKLWERPGAFRLLRVYHEACDDQVLEAYGCLDAPVLDPEPTGRTRYRGWELEYHPHGYGLWPDARWLAVDPNSDGELWRIGVDLADAQNEVDAALDD